MSDSDARKESELHFQSALASFALAISTLDDEEDQRACARGFISLAILVARQQGLVDEEASELFPVPDHLQETIDFALEGKRELDELLDDFRGTDDEEAA